MIDVTKLNKKQTAMLGALIGDAMGVVHEFKAPFVIAEEYIDDPMLMRDDDPDVLLYKAFDVPLGVYSDDFSQQLCVHESFNKSAPFPIEEFYEDMLLWECGKYWVDQKVFDEGMQTISQLKKYRRNREVFVHDVEMSGNGSLMRVLPLAFLSDNLDDLKVKTWHCSAITHNSDEAVLACQFYVILAHIIAADARFDSHPSKSLFIEVWNTVQEDMGWNPLNRKPEFGSGYVMDTLYAVYDCITNTQSYQEAVKRAIMYGHDTDTTACVVGGIAALVFGLQDIDESWLEFIKPSLENEYVKALLSEPM